jgi:hypothetical protein
MKISKGWKFTLNKRISVLLFFLVVGGIYSCKKDKERKQISSREDSFNYYFPLQTDSLDRLKYSPQQGKLHPNKNEMYSIELSKIDEPNLSKLKDSGFIIRLTLFGNFDEYRIQRFEKKNEKWTIYFKVKFRNEEGIFNFNNKVELEDQSTFLLLEKKIQEFHIQNRPTFNESGLDGQTYILEVYKNGHYYFIERWSPKEEDEKEFIELYEMIESLHPVKEIK